MDDLFSAADPNPPGRPFARGDLPAGAFYGPCSGRDIGLALALFGAALDRFLFCDLAYGGGRGTAEGAVPQGWRLVARVAGRDAAAPERQSWHAGDRPFRPEAAVEVWRRPDGSEAVLELRRDTAQDVLAERFGPGRIAAFLHANDGAGEGGSDLWFLKAPDPAAPGDGRSLHLLPLLAPRLATGALVATDAGLAERGFAGNRAFDSTGRRWEPAGTARNPRSPSTPIRLWRCAATV